MLKALIAKLNEPFPESTFGKEKVVEICYVGLFVAGFLFFFNPFGLQNMPLGIGVSSLIFGLITIVFGISYYWASFKLLKIRTDIDSWTLWKWLIFTMVMTCWIAVGNFLYLSLSIPENFSISGFPRMLQYTIMVGLTPVVVGGMLIQFNALKQNQNQAQQIPQGHAARQSGSSTEQITFNISNENALHLDPNNILFIEAMQNYLIVQYIEASDKTVQHQVIRSTLSSAEKKAAGTLLFRCHRSFIVNPLKVENISGNAQGLKLKITGLENKEVPVSRSYIDVVKSKMSNVSD